jgi:hypothetical protein
LSSNSVFTDGGGSYGGILNNCTLSGNSAMRDGGGVYNGTLNNCTLRDNSAHFGGGAAYGTLHNCTLTGNSGFMGGGGAYYGTLRNCIVYYNSGFFGTDNYYNPPYGSSSTFYYSCTTPLPSGPGNIDSELLFVDTNGWSNLRLQTNSPCINAGNNAYAPGLTDLDGRPRIVGGTVDMGAYEFQGAGMGEFIGWLQQFCLRTDGSADYLDSDGDGMNNWQEWRCLTDPTNTLSVLQMQSPANDVSGLTVTWQSVSGVTYFLDRATDLGVQPSFTTLATNIPGQPGTTGYTDTNAVGDGPFFYRVGVQE